MNRSAAILVAATAVWAAGCSSTAPHPRQTTPTPAAASTTVSAWTSTPTTGGASSSTPTTAPTTSASFTWTDTPTAANTQTWTSTSTPTSTRTSTNTPTNSGTSTQTPTPSDTPTCYSLYAGAWATATVVPRRYCFTTSTGWDAVAVHATTANLDLNYSVGCGGNPSSVSSTRLVGKADYLLFRGSTIGAGVCEEGQVVSASGQSSYMVGRAPVAGSVLYTGTVGPVALDAGKAAALVLVGLDSWNSHTFTLSGMSSVMMYLHDPSTIAPNVQTINDSVMVLGGGYGMSGSYPARGFNPGTYAAVVVNDGLQTGSFTLSVSIP